MGEGNEYRKL